MNTENTEPQLQSQPKKSLWIPMILMLVSFVVVVGGLGVMKYAQIRAASAGGHFVPPPEAVTTSIARQEVWQHQLEAPGSFQAVKGAMLSTQESGKVSEIHFDSGESVEKDRVLVQLDVDMEKAQLKAALARAEAAALNHERIHQLQGIGALSQKETDDVTSQLKQTRAEVEQLEAAINRKTIRAPFAGITGIRQVQLGQYLSPGTPVVSLQTMDPIYVNFTLPQQEIPRIQIGQTVQVNVDAFPKTSFEGKVNALDPQIDPTMRTMGVQASLRNPDGKLRSGMYGRVSLTLSEGEKYITLPATAVSRAPYGDSVYVVEKMKDPQGNEYLGARQQFIKIGPFRGEQVAILSGVKDGEEIVSSGLFKLRPGSAVLVNNAVKPADKAISKPADS